MNKNLYIIILGWNLMASVVFIGCHHKTQDDVSPVSTATTDTDINHMKVGANFRYATVDDTKLNVSAVLDNGDPVQGAVFEVFDDDPQFNLNATLLAKGVTGSDGKFSGSFTLPNSIQNVFIRPNYIGLIDVVKAEVISNTINVNFNPSKIPINNNSTRTGNLRTESTITYTYLGTWDSQGVPKYLEPVNDLVDAFFLADINASLPERVALPTVHPDWISTSNETDLILKDSADVWVTFVSEGAGWTNALGFYTYDINNPPTSKSQITKRTIIFPNVSFQGSGGGLISGEKVKIGTFSKNTGIGWFLVANGWNGSAVGDGNYLDYSQPAFNVEVNPNLRAHMVMLNSVARNRVLLSFEDMSREAGSDNDFNDAIFYVSANPYSSIKSTNVVALPATQADDDKDGVYNAFDAYPSDPTRAFNNYFPSTNVMGTLCFEDLWPSKGDFDFNDMVVNYNFNEVLNAQNNVVEIKAKFLIKAIGASYRNGFGIQLPIANSDVSNVTGQHLTNGIITLGANNVETGQTNASVVIFDNPEPLIHRVGGMYFNSETAFAKGSSDTISIVISFTTPISTDKLGPIPFNPFVIINQVRADEIHLPGYAPTDLANKNILGRQDDNSIPSSGRYYVTSGTLPFALNVPVNFDYPIEKVQITAAHLKFATWAQSGGTSFPDWYKNINGYRNASNIYSK